MRNSSETCIFPSHCDQLTHGPEKQLFFSCRILGNAGSIIVNRNAVRMDFEKQRVCFHFSSCCYLHFVVVVVFLIFSRHFLSTLAFLILVRNCGLMMIMMRFQIFKSTVVLFQKAGANPFLQTLNKRDSSRFRFSYAFSLLLLTLHSL